VANGFTCGKCVSACPVEAMTLVSTNDPLHPKMKKARVNLDVCLGCGVCVKACSRNVITLEEREQRVITPVDSVHRTVLMAIEAGKLPNLLFENQAMVSHRVMAAVLGGILTLPPVKQAMASEQMQSRYLLKLIDWGKKRVMN